MRYPIRLTMALAFALWLPLSAQELIANGNFEDTNVCTEYSALCAPEAWFTFPHVNPSVGGNLPEAVDGAKFGNLILEDFFNPVNGRIYLYTGLLCPLEPGKKYRLNFYINASRKKVFFIDAAFDTEEPTPEHFGQTVQYHMVRLTEDNKMRQGSDGWLQVGCDYTASGNEQFLILGNFDKNPLARAEKDKLKFRSACLIDQISLQPLDKSVSPCPELEQKRLELYAQNARHSNGSPTIDSSTQSDVVIQEIKAPEPDTLEYDAEEEEAPEFVQPLSFTIPDIGFEFGKYRLVAAAYPVLDTCYVAIQRTHPRQVRILGYTDNVGSETFNLDLSTKRANAVREWLCAHHTLPLALFSVEGLGERHPLQPNDTEAGRQANRRVEILLEL